MWIERMLEPLLGLAASLRVSPSVLGGPGELRKVLTLATGTGLAQFVGFAFLPILTRIYGPHAIGEQRVFLSIVGVVATAAALSYPTAIVLSRTEDEAGRVARLSIVVAFVFCALLYVPLLLWAPQLSALLNIQSLGDLVFLIPFATFVTVLAATLDQWLVRQQAFGLSARCAVAVALLLGISSTIFGWMQPTASTLVLTGTGGALLGVMLMHAAWRFSAARKASEHSSAEPGATLWCVAKRYRDFPLLRAPQSLINAFSQGAPLLLLGGLFGAATAGQYGLAFSTLAVPAGLAGAAVGSVFYPRITQAAHEGEDVRTLIVRATLGMAVVGIVPLLAILLFAPALFSLVFGSQWRTAGEYAQLLAPWFFLQYINKPAVAAIPVLSLHGGLLIYELFSTGSKIVALWIGFAVFGSAFNAVAAFTVVGVIAYAYMIVWVIRKAPQHRKGAV